MRGEKIVTREEGREKKRWDPAEGTVGGILVGFKVKSIDVLSWQKFKFCSSAIVRNVGDKFTWRLVVVYGSVYDVYKLDFLTELEMVMNT
jgi:hypothetical protein